jgi:hypothetical protein
MGNGVHILHNNIYNNTAGIVTDSFFAGGHPGFPQSGAVFEKNNIYSNNFNDYAPKSDVTSATGVPLGTGILIAGGNGDVVRDNRIWNNWRRGTMLLAVPDAISCAPGTQTCTIANASSDSFGNRYYDNVMGRAPGGKAKPNGVDFWWDNFPTNTGNCWFNNRGPDGTNASWTGDPARAPVPNQALPGFLPESCGAPTNSGTGDPAKEAVLLNCANAATGDQSCEWYTAPPKPGTKAAARYQRVNRANGERLLAAGQLAAPGCQLVGDTLSCEGFGYRP